MKNRFRIRNGDVEVEYEGILKEVNERYKNILDWVMTNKKKPQKQELEEDNKKSKRGGARKAIYPQEIEKLKKEGFFKSKKTVNEVEEKFGTMGVPTRGKRGAIRNALVNDTRKKESKLKATKEQDEWVFWED